MDNEIIKYLVDYIELGKIYTDFDASDFQILNYSRDEVLVEAGEEGCEYFMQGLLYPPPDTTLFSKTIPNLSCCFIRVRNPRRPTRGDFYYLFIQIQRRGEGDFAKSKGKIPRVNRSFNHIRFVYLGNSNKDNFFLNTLETYLREGYKVFSELLYSNEDGSLSMGNDANALRDYLPNSKGTTVSAYFDTARLTKIDLMNQPEAVKGLVNLLVANLQETGKYLVQIVDRGYLWKEKLILIEAAIVLIWPISGLLSFSLDYISERDDISIQFFHEPHLGRIYPRKSIADYIQNRNSFDELVQLRDVYGKYFENMEFIKTLRILVLSGARIINSANISAAICDLPEGKAQEVLKDSTNVHALIRGGVLIEFLRRFRKQVEIQDFLNESQWVLSQYSDVITKPLFLEILGLVLEDKVTDVELPLFVSFINNYEHIWLKNQEMFNQLVAFLGSFSNLLKISKELKPIIVGKVFASLSIELETKPKLMTSEVITWLTLFSELNAAERKRFTDFLVIILRDDIQLVNTFLNKNPGLRVDFYRDVIHYLLNQNAFFESSLMQDWVPGKNIDFDEVVGGMVVAGEIKLMDFIEHALESKGVEKLRWLLKVFKTEVAFLKTAEKIISLGDNIKADRTEDYIKKFELCLTNIKSLERMDEKIERVEALREKFAYNIFPVSDYTEKWFFEKIQLADESEITQIIDKLRQHPRLEEGLENNKKLGLYCSPKLQFSVLLKRYLNREVPQKLFFALVFMSSDHELSNIVLILLDHLGKENKSNDILFEFVKRRKLVYLERKAISQWLEMTRHDRLRVKYMEGSYDLLRAYITRLPNSNDERLYETYVYDPLNLEFQLFWLEYVEALPKNKEKGTRYSKVLEVIQSIGPKIDISVNGNKLLKQCAQIAELQIMYAANSEKLVSELQGYLSSETLIWQLEQYVRSIIEKNQKKEVGLLSRRSGSWGDDARSEKRQLRPALNADKFQIDYFTPVILAVILCLILAAIPMVYELLSIDMTDLTSIVAMFALGVLGIVFIGILIWYVMGGRWQ